MATIITPYTTQTISITYPSTTYPAPPTYTGSSGPAGISGRTQQQNGYAFFDSKMHLLMPSGGAPRKGIIALHGANQTAYQAVIGGNWGDYTFSLSDRGGYAILGLDHGQLSFYNPLSMAAVDAAYTVLTTLLGTPTAKVGLLASSMGGGTALQWAKKNPTKTACVAALAPSLNVDNVHGSSDWTVPTACIPQPGDANYDLYPGDWPDTTNGPAVDYAYLVSNPTFNGGPSPYNATEWANNVVANGYADLNRHPENWRGIGVPIRLWKAQRDGTGPYQEAVWWVGQVNDPLVTIRPLITRTGADHMAGTWGTMNAAMTAPSGLSDYNIQVQGGVPRWEFVDFFAQYLG